MQRHLRTRALGLALLALALAACNRDADRDAAAPPPVPPAAGTEVTHAEFSQLRWLEGTWRVAPDSGAQAPVFERYTFPDDSTMLVEGYPDASLALVFETRRFILRNGRLVNPIEGASWVAVALDSGTVRFDPQAGARNSFSWRPVSPDTGKAVRIYPATRRRAARQQAFTMVRQKH